MGGGVQLGFILNRGVGLSWVLLQKIYSVSMRVLNVSQHLYVFCLKDLVEVGTKDKHLVRTEN